MIEADIKIVSGGQTGVDQGALQAAIDLGLDWGGWAPKGWRTEDGPFSPVLRLKMREHEDASYLGRTRQNVIDSNATLILVDSYPLTGGTLKTHDFCHEYMRPHLAVNLVEEGATDKAWQWLERFFADRPHSPFVLNIAGPRESKSPGIRERVRKFLMNVLRPHVRVDEHVYDRLLVAAYDPRYEWIRVCNQDGEPIGDFGCRPGTKFATKGRFFWKEMPDGRYLVYDLSTEPWGRRWKRKDEVVGEMPILDDASPSK